MHFDLNKYLLLTAVSCLLTLLPNAETFAQYPSDNGLFEVNEIRGCPGLTVLITNNNPACDCLSGCSCDFDYNGDGNYTVQADIYEYTYDAAGVYRLEVLFDNVSDFITITIEDKPAPEFEVYSCSGNGVAVRVTDTNYEEYQIDFGDGTPLVIIPQGSGPQTHTYPDASPRTITVQGFDTGWANNCNPSSHVFTPIAALPVSEIQSLTETGPEQITLDLDTSPDILYRLFISTNGGPYNVLGNFSDARSSEVIDLQFLPNNYYCFRLDAIDLCGGSPVSSSEVCSIQIQGSNQNNVNRLVWDTEDPDADFGIYRDGQLIGSVGPAERFFEDPDVNCGTTYCYVLETRYGNAITRSREVCILADNSLPPAPVDHLSTVPDGSTVNLSWNYSAAPGSAIFNIYRRQSDGTAQLIGSTDSNAFTDTEAINPGFVTWCYEVIPEDACGNLNPSNIEACVIQLDGSMSLRDEVELSWPPYSGYASGVAYYFVERSFDGSAFIATGQTADTVFTENLTSGGQTVYYRIRAVSNDGITADSYSYVVMLTKSPRLFYPEAFTPDGDGMNDTFEISARFVESFTLDIFNRWGELIYHTEDISNAWDGNYRGEVVPQGTYIIKIRMIDEAGQETNQDASILVLPH